MSTRWSGLESLLPAAVLLLASLAGSCGQEDTGPAGDPLTSAIAQAEARYAAAPSTKKHAASVIAARDAMARRDFPEAIRLLSSLAPGEVTGEAWFLLGTSHAQLKQDALAVAAFEEALAAGPGFPRDRQLFYLLGRSLQELGRLAPARAAYGVDSRLMPEQGDAHFRLALLDFELGELDASMDHARLALERFERPQDLAKVHAHLADLALAEGEHERARRELEKSVQLFPHYEALYELSRLCARAGDDEAAAAYLQAHQELRRRAGR